ncbi:hypothetical protein BCR44DRAFT_177891 [Catenaria anguillulae PL171]|uniref:Uncharacterized protein n=1 Tax=Catenaria anguillulae PL171 TaxID=765915 RepID=A0A1Y2H9W2_9FUNG|nr:hypothetical protein BCR44DRAFT_177891 [Catenaria anguillulae PL171]
MAFWLPHQLFHLVPLYRTTYLFASLIIAQSPRTCCRPAGFGTWVCADKFQPLFSLTYWSLPTLSGKIARLAPCLHRPPASDALLSCWLPLLATLDMLMNVFVDGRGELTVGFVSN